jgi:hypothetical protein
MMLKEIEMTSGHFLEVVRLTQASTDRTWKLRTPLRLYCELKFMRVLIRVQNLPADLPGKLKTKAQ